VHHVPGCQNAAADALSHFNFQVFRRLHPSVNATPTPVPSSVLHRLLCIS
jgi:hypothetical protein